MRELEKAVLRMELPFTKVRRKVRSEEAGLRVSGARTKLETLQVLLSEWLLTCLVTLAIVV